MALMFVFQMYFMPQSEQVKEPAKTAAGSKSEEQPKTDQKQEPRPQTSAKKMAESPKAEKMAKKDVVVDTPLFTVTFTDLGGGIKSVVLKNYKEKVKSTEGKELVENIKPFTYFPKITKTVNNETVDDRNNLTASKDRLSVTDKPETLIFTGTMSDGKPIKKIYTFNPTNYAIDVKFEFGGSTEKTNIDIVTISSKETSDYTFRGPFLYDGKSLTQVEKIEKPIDHGKSYAFAGFDEGYFASIWIPSKDYTPAMTIFKEETGTPVLRLSQERQDFTGKIYLGPKETGALKSLGVNAEKIIDYGWFDIIAKPLIMFMNLTNKVTRNYGLDIIILTILIKIIFYPLTIASYKSMNKMKKVQPQIAALKEKYKNDSQKMNAEMMDLYKRHKVNPLGGCLPMIIQIPVFFALYKGLTGAIELRHAPFFLWINDLSAAEDLFSFALFGYTIPIRILPLVMGASQFVQQKMTPTPAANPMQEKIMMLMPVVFTVMFYGFSSGLVLYWLVNNIISIAQQYYYMKKSS